MAAAGCQQQNLGEVPSAPQGWQASPTRTGTSRPTTAVAPTVKPMTAPAPRRQGSRKAAPSRQQRRGNDGPSENERPSSASRVLVEKLRTEVSTLQKTVTNFRAENQSLKAKTKRLEEENLRKARQMDKLALTCEHAKSVAAAEKKRDAEALNLLKQKCIKLEKSLREKDSALRRINSAEKRLPRTQASPLQTRKQTSREQPRKTTGAPASDLELSRLRDTLHRMTEENRRMSQHLREKEQELRQLRLQLKQTTLGARKAATKGPPARPKDRAGSATLESRQQRPVSSLPKRSNTFNVGKRTALTASTGTGDGDACEADERKKPVGEPSPDRGTGARPTNPSPKKMSEEVAAKKIQRTWRDHRKRKATKSAEASLESSQLSNA